MQTERNMFQDDATLAKFRADLDSLTLFRFAANSFAGRMGHRSSFMVTPMRVARAVTELGNLMRYERLVPVSLSVIKAMNPHASSKDWQAGLFGPAALTLGLPYVDVERATGPEACRWSDATTPYKTAEKLLVLETLLSLCDDWIGPGWCATVLASELGVQLPARAS